MKQRVVLELELRNGNHLHMRAGNSASEPWYQANSTALRPPVWRWLTEHVRGAAAASPDEQAALIATLVRLLTEAFPDVEFALTSVPLRPVGGVPN